MNIIKRITNWYFSKGALPYWCVLVLDCIFVMASGYLGAYLDNGGMQFAQHFWSITHGLLVSLALFITFFRIFHTYIGIVRYSSFVDLQKVFLASFSASVCILVVSLVMKSAAIEAMIMPSISTVCLMFVFTTLFMFLIRVIVKGLFDTIRIGEHTKKVFIYGINQGGVSLAKSIANQNPVQYSLAGFVSPEGDLDTKYLMGVKVRKDGPNLIKHMKEEGATVLLVSPLQSIHFRDREDLINQLMEAGVKIMMMPAAEEWDGKSELSHSKLREVEIEDLLPRDEIKVDMDAIGAMLTGKRILITGAAGSIGSEMVRQVAPYKPAEMILIDQAETPMHDIRLMMLRQFPDVKNETIVTSITDKSHMERIFSEHRPEYVFHAAAYKHVPMMEDNPGQAVRNNINGTRIIADLAVKYGTRKFVMISTDKAVNPTNVMGCSKRICEIYCQSLNKAISDGTLDTSLFTLHSSLNGKAVTQFVTTRFGNVLGSNGSVIPLFKKQIRKGGPITVTHPDIIRFFMLIPEACKLVLEAGTMGKGGEIFVFDMGKPVRIVDLAKRMISLSGAKGIDIKFTGLRDGEKLYEEVLNDAEGTKPTVHPKIKVANVREYDYNVACLNEKRLLEASESFDDMAIVKIMKEIVPEYKSRQSKYEVLDN